MGSFVKLIGNRCSTSGLLKIASYKPIVSSYGDKSSYESQRQEAVESRSVQFSQSRTRDQSGATIDLKNDSNEAPSYVSSSYTYDTPSYDSSSYTSDNHVGSYDSHGTISLNSVMQSNVPEPYSTQGKKAPTHLNMPGGHFGQDAKYLSDNLQKTHSHSPVANTPGREYHSFAGERTVD